MYSNQIEESLTVPQIIDRIKGFPCKLVEITGGEPTLQKGLIPLCEALNKLGYQILLETNGSVLLRDIPQYVVKIIDVKTPGSGVANAWCKSNLNYLMPGDELKFVLTDHEDYEYAKSFLLCNKLEECKVLFSPVVTSLAPDVLAKWILDDGLDVRLQLQLHKIIWKNIDRGV